MRIILISQSFEILTCKNNISVTKYISETNYIKRRIIDITSWIYINFHLYFSIFIN